MDPIEIKYFVESALLAAGRPLNVDQIKGLFDGRSAPDKPQIREAIAGLNEDYANRGIEVKEVASGFRMQVKASMADRLQKLWEERPPRYSRALFETLALIAYRQPMTRGEIEEVRGVAVSSNITRSLLEREWIRVVGHRDVPGRPALFGTTKLFLDYFGLKKLEDLPPLSDLSDWETLRVQLNLPEVEDDEVAVESADVTELPVLQPETQGDDDIETDDVLAVVDDILDEIPILQPELEAEADAVVLSADMPDSAETAPNDEFDELVASEWLDPADEKADDNLAEETVEPGKDVDVTVSR